MIDKETMNLLSKMTEELHKLKTEEDNAIIFFALSEKYKSATCLIKGGEAAVMASLASLIDSTLKNAPSENKKKMKGFLISHILQM